MVFLLRIPHKIAHRTKTKLSASQPFFSLKLDALRFGMNRSNRNENRRTNSHGFIVSKKKKKKKKRIKCEKW